MILHVDGTMGKINIFAYLKRKQHNYDVWEPGCMNCGRQGAGNKLSGQPGAKD